MSLLSCWEGKGRFIPLADVGYAGCTGKNLWDPLRTRAIPERLRGVSRQGSIQIHVYLYLYLYLLVPLLIDGRCLVL